MQKAVCVLLGSLMLPGFLMANTFECAVESGDTFYSARKLDGCEVVQNANAKTLQSHDVVGAIWHVPSQKIDTDVVIRKPEPVVKVVPMKIHLRNQPPPVASRTSSIPKYKEAPPPPPPISSLARQKQVLQAEMSREKSALRKDEATLSAAKAANKKTTIPRLERNVADRRANIRALEVEYQKLR